jgi:hypothetical protein
MSSNERTHPSPVAIGVGTSIGVDAALVLLIAMTAFVSRRRRPQPKRTPTGLELSQKDAAAAAGTWAFGQGNAYGPDAGQDAGLGRQGGRKGEPPPPVQEMEAGEEASGLSYRLMEGVDTRGALRVLGVQYSQKRFLGCKSY